MNKLTRRSLRLGAALALALMLVGFGVGRSLAYVCGGMAHCHGLNIWSISSGEYFGAATDISMVHLSCDPATCASTDFITDEMWLVDSTSCAHQDNGLCWVETGYINSPPPDPNNPNQSTNQSYFWADERPGS